MSEETGDVYVVDAGNQRVERFHPSDAGKEGEPLAVWGWGVTDGEAKYEICESGCKAGIGGTGEGQLDYPKNAKGGVALKGHERAAIAIAVDNSSNAGDASKGDVYVVSNTASASENMVRIIRRFVSAKLVTRFFLKGVQLVHRCNIQHPIGGSGS